MTEENMLQSFRHETNNPDPAALTACRGCVTRGRGTGFRRTAPLAKAIAVALALIPAPTLAQWQVEHQGAKVMSHRNDPVGTIAKLPAKAASHETTAYLQVECFEYPPLFGKHLGLVLSKATMPGPITYQYRFDRAAAVRRGPYSRTNLTVVNLGDAASEEFKGLSKAKRLQLTLSPARGPEYVFDFELSGAGTAIDAIPCREARPRQRDAE